jgi:hypothetical protein
MQLYFGHLTKANKPPSEKNKKETYRAWTRFLLRLNKPIIESSVTAVVKQKKDNPEDTTFEEELTIWKMAERSTMSVQNSSDEH